MSKYKFKTMFCLPKILFLFFSILFGITTTSNAVDIADIEIVPPGYKVENQFSLPDGIPHTLPIGFDPSGSDVSTPLGDIVFSADGNTLYILIGPESAESAVWSVQVNRDVVSGRVISLGSATLFFSFSPNPGSIDTSLEFHPSGNGTLFFRTNDLAPVTFLPVVGGGDVGQRTSDGTIHLFTAAGAFAFGGLVFMPSELRALNGIDLLVGDWFNGVTNSYSLTDNGDGTFTPVFIEEKSPYSNTGGVSFATGDQHFVPTGDFANDLMFADSSGPLPPPFVDGTIGIIDIDPDTGFPVGGGSTPTQFASGFGAGPWGLEFDPITNDLFISNWELDTPNSIIQISGFPAPVPEPINIDIKPRRCPNRLFVNCTRKWNRILKVAILGTENFDVRDIDVDSIRLNWVEPFKPSKAKFKDVTCPTVLEPCDCEVLVPDTYEDLVLKFNIQEIAASLGDVEDGEEIPLALTGILLDGTLIEGIDCVLIKDKGNDDDDSCSNDNDKKNRKKRKKRKKHHDDDDSSDDHKKKKDKKK